MARFHEAYPRPGKELLLSSPTWTRTRRCSWRSYGLIAEAAAARLQIAPAGMWLLDNSYRVEEQIRLARKHLPEGYGGRLPRLLKGPLAGYPRAYGIARELVLHMDGNLDEESVRRFVAAYQTVRTLNLGELWSRGMHDRAPCNGWRCVLQALHTGRGGWTWYTGSAGWWYRLMVEFVLGLKLEVNRLIFAPLARQDWHPYKVRYRYVDTFYHMSFIRDGPSTDVVSVTLGGAVQSERMLTLTGDRMDHYVEVRMGLGLQSEPKGQG
jgi:hypothetical protein